VLIAAMFHNNQLPDRVFEEIAGMDAARARGHELIAQVSACPLTMDFTLKSAYVFESVSAWKRAISAPVDELRVLYADPDFRARVKADLAAQQGRGLFNGEWHLMHVAQVARPENLRFEGHSIQELAAAHGQDPLDWMLDFGLREGLETWFTGQLRNTDPQAVGRLVADPHTHVSLSDAGAHLTFLCDAAFGLHTLGYWARDQRALSLPEAVRKLTSQPAALFGLQDRGVLQVGKAADLLLFDPQTVGRGPNERRFDLPAGASRLRARGEGVHGVWVNGRRVVDEDGLRDEAPRAGRLLRAFRAAH
jgi:N-acyl-D-aspartate/D-glutamate deacylase